MPFKSYLKIEERSNKSHPKSEENNALLANSNQQVVAPAPTLQTKKPRVTWHERLQQLAAFKKKHGHVDVPRTYTKHSSLGQYVMNTRQKYKRMNEGKADNIDESRIRQLNALGFKWVLKVSLISRFYICAICRGTESKTSDTTTQIFYSLLLFLRLNNKAKDQPKIEDSDDEDTSGSRTKSKSTAPANITPQPVAMKTISYSQSQTEIPNYSPLVMRTISYIQSQTDTNYSYLMSIKNQSTKYPKLVELPQVWGTLLHFEPSIVGNGYCDTNWEMQDSTKVFVESLLNETYSGIDTVPANMFENDCVDDLVLFESESMI